jgi:hypothetical protein
MQVARSQPARGGLDPVRRTISEVELRYEVTVQSVPSRQVAVVRDRRRWADLGAKLLPLLDRVYVAVRAGKVVQTGQNIFIYRDGSKDEVSVEVGVEAAAAFESAAGVLVVYSLQADPS